MILNLIVLAGIAAIAAGAGLIYAPAGLIVGGVLTLAAAYLHELGRLRTETPAAGQPR